MQGVQGPLQHLAQQAVRLQPGQECSVQEVKETAAAVFGTGFFSSCGTKANDTPDGTEIVIEVWPTLSQSCVARTSRLAAGFVQVEANPVLRGVQLKGSTELPDRVVGEAFRGQEGGVINFARFSGALKQINGWYQEHGVFGQVQQLSLCCTALQRCRTPVLCCSAGRAPASRGSLMLPCFTDHACGAEQGQRGRADYGGDAGRERAAGLQ